MANLRSILVLLLVTILTLALISSASAQRNKNNKNNKNKGQQQQQRPIVNKRPKPQQNRPNKPAQDSGSPKVFTTTLSGLGKIRGRSTLTEWTGQNVMQFLDIPYGKAERFKVSLAEETLGYLDLSYIFLQPAEPIAPWKGVLQAHSHHAGCPSIQNLLKYSSLEENGFDVEDCLRLTVITKSVS